MSSLKRLIYDVRASFNDSEASDQTFLNNLTHQYLIDNPEIYSAEKITLNASGNTSNSYTITNVNCFFAVSDKPFKIIFNDIPENFLITHHFSFVNLTELNSFTITTPSGIEMGIGIQLFYATITT